MPKSCSRITGYFYMGHHPIGKPHPILNVAILIKSNTLCHIVSSAAKAKVGGIFHNVQMAISICRMLIILGHPQPLTPIKTNNSTTNSFVYDNILNLKNQSPGTCATTGSTIGSTRNSSKYSGNQDLRTMETTLRNIMQHCITNLLVHYMFVTF